MDRLIKFRAIGLSSKEFVFGDLIHGVGAKSGNYYILPRVINLAYVKNCDPLDGVKVDPKSIGQFTGLYDMHGKEIYEGDIVQDFVSIQNAEVVFTDYANFGLKDTNICDSEYDIIDSAYTSTTCVVIGNIYENPDLI